MTAVRTALALITAAVLALAGPVPAGARGVVQQPTITTVTSSVADSTVTLAIVVAAEEAPVPEGTVEVTENGTSLGTLPLADGDATWTGTVANGFHTFDVTYRPADERWAGSQATVDEVWVGGPVCPRGCEPPYVLKVRTPKPVVQGSRAKILITAASRSSIEVTGWVRVRLEGPKGFTWSGRADLKRGGATLRSRRVHRPGRYTVTTLLHPDHHPEGKATTSLTVVKRRR